MAGMRRGSAAGAPAAMSGGEEAAAETEGAGVLRRLGVWVSDKKSQKLNWRELRAAGLRRRYALVKLDLEVPLEEQGPIHVFLHKLTDIIALADQGDTKAKEIINGVERYLSNHPEITVIDPLDKVRILLDRHRYYTILEQEPSFQLHGIFTPPFSELTTANYLQNVEILRKRGVTFPVVCKPTVAHGSKSAHEMVVIFNERGLSVCKPPCVVQSFVNHNAVLYKVFLIGNRYHISERPSLKNFYPSEECEPIYYNAHDVCKADSQSTLSILDPQDQPHAEMKMTLDEAKITQIIKVLRNEIGLVLMGFDVVIDNSNGNHAVIDINVYPGYDNFPNFFDNFLSGVDSAVKSKQYDDHTDCDSDGDKLSKVCNGLINVGTIYC